MNNLSWVPTKAAMPLILLVTTPSAASAAPDYSIAAVNFRIGEKELVGHKRAGLVCLPNGSIRFDKVDLPPSEALKETIADSLSRTIKMATAQDAIFGDNDSRYVIVGDILAMKLSLCATKWGLGNRSDVKGSSEVTVRWDVYSRATKEIEASLTTTGSAEARSASAGMAILIANAVVASAQAFAAHPTLATIAANGRPDTP